MTNHTSDVTGLAFTPDGRHLASASDDGTIRLWNVENLGECLCLRSSHDHLTALAMLPDGRTLISGGTSGSVCFWDLSVTNRNPGSLLMRVSSGLEIMAEVDAPGYAGARLDPRVVRRCGGAFKPDSRQFVALDCAGALALWDAYPVRLVKQLPEFGSKHWGVALAPNGRWLVSGDASGTVTFWDWRAQGVVTNFALPFEWFGLLRFRCGGRYLLAGAVRNDLTLSVKIWRTAKWEEVPLTGRQFAGLWSLDLSSDESLLAPGYVDGTVRLFHYPYDELETTLLGHRGPVNSVHFLPGNREL